MLAAMLEGDLRDGQKAPDTKVDGRSQSKDQIFSIFLVFEKKRQA